MLDTGAVYTTITPELADAVGYSVRDGVRRTRVRTAVGSEEGYLLHMSKLEILGLAVPSFPVHVFDLGHEDIDGLVGLNLLTGLNCEVRSAERRIPDLPVSGRLLGKVGPPIAIEVIDWTGSELEQHDLHFFMTAPPQPCAATQSTPGFVIDLGSTLRKGLTAPARSRVKRPPSALVMWDEPGNAIATAPAGWFTATIDEIGKDVVKGRVFAWFDDASRSMLVGAFTAKNCNFKP